MQSLKAKMSEFKNQTRFEKILYIGVMIFSILGIIIGFTYSFNSHDHLKASPKDFDPLYEQKAQIEKDFACVIDMDNAQINKKEKIITLNSKECKLQMEYDNNHNIISFKEIDNSESLRKVIFLSVLSSVIWAVCLPGAIIVCLIIIMWIWFFCKEFVLPFLKKAF